MCVCVCAVFGWVGGGQEAAAAFAHQAQEQPQLKHKYALLAPGDLDGRRNQNSLILVDRSRFLAHKANDVTQVYHQLAHPEPYAPPP